MSSDREKAMCGAGTFTNFCQQFGEDVYAQILLEVLLEGLLHEEDVFIFGEQEQGGDQAGDGTSMPEPNSGSSQQPS